MRALESRDYRRMAEIVRMAHDVLHDYMDSGNRKEPHTYDAQNERAAEEQE